MTRFKCEPVRGIQFVFLDRDGVINRKAAESNYIFRWEDFDLLPGVETAIATLNRSGIHVIVVTNQRGVSLGLYTLDQVVELHTSLQKRLAAFGAHIDAFYVCPHGHGECNCRKPATGLLEEAFRDFPAANITNSLLIGDSLSDLQLAHNFGIPFILIDGTENPDEGDKNGELRSMRSSSLRDAVHKYLCPVSQI